MNFVYVPDPLRLEQVLAQAPTATLHELRRSHPSFRSMSIDQLALRLDRLQSQDGDGRLK